MLLMLVLVLFYLNQANRFSNTPQALTEYLGLTKGTVSQTVLVLESRCRRSRGRRRRTAPGVLSSSRARRQRGARSRYRRASANSVAEPGRKHQPPATATSAAR